MAVVAAQRPDLLALRAGYASQEARLRQAVWAQFPVISLTWNRLRDTSDIWSSGLSAVLNLPLFGGARGDIAVQTATREALRAEYRDRLAQSSADIHRLLAEALLQQAHADDLRAALPRLATMVEQAERGADSGDLAAVIATSLRATLLTKQLELTDVEQALWETRVALDTLLGRVSQ
jgi:outer membrane protein TolC